MKTPVCKGCHKKIIRKRLSNGRLEHKVHYESRSYHDLDCKLMHSTRRRASHYARF